MTSPFFKINAHDLLKGLVVAALSAALFTLQKLVESNGLNLATTDLKAIAAAALAAGLGYLLKQLFTDKEGKLGGII